MPISSRGLWAFVFACVLAFAADMANSREKSTDERPDSWRYRAYLPNYILLVYFGVLMPIALFDRTDRMREAVLSLCFGVFLHICVYYLLLSVLMPLLRKGISSRVCAALWLLPNYLYLMANGVITPRVPKWAVYVPEGVLKVVCLVWAAGFAAVLGWKLVGHFRFRDSILAQAWDEDDPEILALWEKEQRRAGVRHDGYRLVRSPAVTTPLTIGFFRGSIRVVLPERSYTPGQLGLIFRHELVHIGREDTVTKFFLTFCTAMCWFNPLMWWAMRRSADDLELSCDETVLLDAEDKTRMRYADLLLRTAGDERGFTTCLSASARALRYRLGYVVKPKKRPVGSAVVGVVFFALIMTCGHVTLAYDRLSGGECIFGGGELAQYEVVKGVHWQEPGGHYVCKVVDTAELNEYLAGLTFYEITNQYDFSDTERYMDLNYQGPDGETRLSLTDHVLGISRPSDQYWQHYFIQEDIDWDYLHSQLSIDPNA